MELVRQKNVATYIVFPIVDADGDLVSGAAGLDSEIDAWADGSAPDGFTDCTNEATEIGSTGMYYLSLVQGEMNADYIVIQVKTSSTGAKTQVILIRTMVGDPLNLGTHTSGRELGVESDGDLTKVNTLDGHTAQTGDAYARIGAAGASLSGIPWNASWDAEIQSECLDALNEYDPPTLAELTARTIASAGYATASNLATVDTVVDAIKLKTDLIPATPAATGDIPTAVQIRQEIDSNSTQLAAIVADTNELQAEWVNGGRLDLLIDSIISTLGAAGAGLTAIPWNSAWDTEVQSECLDALNEYDPPTLAELTARTIAAAGYATASALTTVDTVVDAIKLKTDLIPAAPAATGDIPTVTQIRQEMDSNSTQLAAIVADTNELQAEWVNGGRLDLIIDAILEDTAVIGAAGAGLTALPWNAAWDAEVQSECYDALNTAFDDASTLTANSLFDRARTYGWILRNKVEITDANGNTVIKKDDNTTDAFSVAAALTDDSTTTIRKRME